jgi:2-polyprenyl-3-methyl-5-hydroxy-6-metoxy-1,4-benzoquinol methylase
VSDDHHRSQAAVINRKQIWPERNIPLDRHSLYRKIDAIMRALPPGRVLEIGCDQGRYLSMLKARGWDVVGLDIQPQEHDFIVQHDAALPLPFKGEFDVVIAAEVIEHIVSTDDFLMHCEAVLKSDGLLILTTPNLLFWVNRVRMLFNRRPLFAYADYHVRMFIWSDLQEKISRQFRINSLGGSHVLMGMRHSKICAIFAYLGDYLPLLSAHFIVTATPISGSK